MSREERRGAKSRFETGYHGQRKKKRHLDFDVLLHYLRVNVTILVVIVIRCMPD
jgi:hypothetical protein